MVTQVWELARTKTTFYSTICKVNEYRFNSPDARRVLHAKDWLTYWRQDGSADDNANVNRELGHPADYYSGECIADVEHFFVAAFMEVAIGPSLSQVGFVGWETFDILLKKPVLTRLPPMRRDATLPRLSSMDSRADGEAGSTPSSGTTVNWWAPKNPVSRSARNCRRGFHRSRSGRFP